MMKLNTFSASFLCIFVLLVFLFVESGLASGRADDFIKMKSLGGAHDCKGNQKSAEIESIGRFAVQEHNKKENALLEFTRVLKAKEQVVAGKIYHLTLEVNESGKSKIYEAKVWVKPWMNFKQLQEFKHAHDIPHSTPSNLGVIRGH